MSVEIQPPGTALPSSGGSSSHEEEAPQTMPLAPDLASSDHTPLGSESTHSYATVNVNQPKPGSVGYLIQTYEDIIVTRRQPRRTKKPVKVESELELAMKARQAAAVLRRSPCPLERKKLQQQEEEKAANGDDDEAAPSTPSQRQRKRPSGCSVEDPAAKPPSLAVEYANNSPVNTSPLSVNRDVITSPKKKEAAGDTEDDQGSAATGDTEPCSVSKDTTQESASPKRSLAKSLFSRSRSKTPTKQSDQVAAPPSEAPKSPASNHSRKSSSSNHSRKRSQTPEKRRNRSKTPDKQRKGRSRTPDKRRQPKEPVCGEGGEMTALLNDVAPKRSSSKSSLRRRRRSKTPDKQRTKPSSSKSASSSSHSRSRRSRTPDKRRSSSKSSVRSSTDRSRRTRSSSKSSVRSTGNSRRTRSSSKSSVRSKRGSSRSSRSLGRTAAPASPNSVTSLSESFLERSRRTFFSGGGTINDSEHSTLSCYTNLIDPGDLMKVSNFDEKPRLNGCTVEAVRKTKGTKGQRWDVRVIEHQPNAKPGSMSSMKRSKRLFSVGTAHLKHFV